MNSAERQSSPGQDRLSPSDQNPSGRGSRRRAGVLLHVTALPGPGQRGSFGSAAHAWIELLARSGVGAWQVLPLAPTDGTGSPYSSPSGSALNPELLDGEPLQDPGHLPPDDQRAFRQWQRRQRFWLRDHCRFMVLRRLHQGLPWWQWPQPLAHRQPAALRQLERQQRQALEQEALLQWQLEQQWQGLRHHARQAGVELLGDLPFYVAHDSADVWSRPQLFELGEGGALRQQSGVPPDYFSATGQLWGTPVYHWPQHWLGGFRWWLRRLQRQLELFDRLRLDHFRALEGFWSVPGGDPTAEGGRWRRSPGGPLLALLWLQCLLAGRLQDGNLPLIAEDLGVITPAVERLRDHFALPGMKVLQFAFDGDPANPYLPANLTGSRWVVYTGTHDNPTSIGWWRELDDGTRARVETAVGAPVTAPGWQLLELALASAAELVVVPLQDLLELGDEARFNTPGTATGNWCWRLQQPIGQLEGPVGGFGAMAARYGRGSDRAPGAAAGGPG